MHDLFASLPIPQFFNLPFHDFSMYQIRKVPETGKSRALRFLRNCLWWMTRLGCDCLWLSAWVKCCIFQLSTWIRPLSVWAFTASTQLCRRNPLSHGLRRRRHSAAMEGNELGSTVEGAQPLWGCAPCAKAQQNELRISATASKPRSTKGLGWGQHKSEGLKPRSFSVSQMSPIFDCQDGRLLTSRLASSRETPSTNTAKSKISTMNTMNTLSFWSLAQIGLWMYQWGHFQVARKLCWRAWAAMKLLASYRSAQIWTWNWLWYDDLSRFEQTLWHSSDERPNAVTASLEESGKVHRMLQNGAKTFSNDLKCFRRSGWRRGV